MEFGLRSDDVAAATRAVRDAAAQGVPDAIASTSDQAAKAAVAAGRGAIAGAPGRWPKTRTQMTATGDRVALSAPWAGPANWGASTHTVFGRRMNVNASPALATIWGRPIGGAGYIIGPALARTHDETLKAYADDALAAFSQEFDRKRVPRGR